MNINEFMPQNGRMVKEDSEIINVANLQESLAGKYSIELTGTLAIAAPDGYFISCIVPSSDMVIASKTDLSGAINADLTTIANHPAGIPIYTNITGITLTSGDGIGYLSKVV